MHTEYQLERTLLAGQIRYKPSLSLRDPRAASLRAVAPPTLSSRLPDTNTDTDTAQRFVFNTTSVAEAPDCRVETRTYRRP